MFPDGHIENGRKFEIPDHRTTGETLGVTAPLAPEARDATGIGAAGDGKTDPTGAEAQEVDRATRTLACNIDGYVGNGDLAYIYGGLYLFSEEDSFVPPVSFERGAGYRVPELVGDFKDHEVLWTISLSPNNRRIRSPLDEIESRRATIVNQILTSPDGNLLVARSELEPVSGRGSVGAISLISIGEITYETKPQDRIKGTSDGRDTADTQPRALSPQEIKELAEYLAYLQTSNADLRKIKIFSRVIEKTISPKGSNPLINETVDSRQKLVNPDSPEGQQDTYPDIKIIKDPYVSNPWGEQFGPTTRPGSRLSLQTIRPYPKQIPDKDFKWWLGR